MTTLFDLSSTSALFLIAAVAGIPLTRLCSQRLGHPFEGLAARVDKVHGSIARIGLVTVAAALWISAPAAWAKNDFRLVGNASIPFDVMDARDVSNIFLKKQLFVSTGVVADVIDQNEDSSVRKAFSKVVHDRSVSKVSSYWRKRIFAGEGTPPAAAQTDLEVLEYVRSHPGGLGYISAATPATGVRIISVLTEPKRVKMIEPIYTREARLAAFSGVTVLEVTVDSEGNPTISEVIQPLPHGLTEAAIDAVKRWKYRPATLDGVATSTSVQVKLEFELEEPSRAKRGKRG